MEGYDLITAVDDKTWGTVVGREDDYVIVEHGLLRKHRYAVPESSTEVDDEARQVRTTLAGELIADSPKVDDGLDRSAVAAHYGLADTYEAPPTEGWGDTVSSDPAEGAEAAEERAGMETAVEQRARIREGDAAGYLGDVPEESPAMLGDRYADVHRKDEEDR
jgi:hypothetical protein